MIIAVVIRVCAPPSRRRTNWYHPFLTEKGPKQGPMRPVGTPRRRRGSGPHQVAPLVPIRAAPAGVGMRHPAGDGLMTLRQVRGPSVATLRLCTGSVRARKLLARGLQVSGLPSESASDRSRCVKGLPYAPGLCVWKQPDSGVIAPVDNN
jgi:hypothetical protein